MTRARLQVYTADGATLLGTLGRTGLRFSAESTSGGGADFTTSPSRLDSLGARDSVVRLELQTGPSTWTPVAVYTLRRPFTRERIARPMVGCRPVSLLEQWASEALILPEYVVGDLPQGAGTERAAGWPSSAYDPASDPAEAWDGCYETSRTAMPDDFPTGSGAKWISVTGATDESERKYLRATLTVDAPKRVKIWYHSDESATLYVAGEPVIEWSGAESTWSGSPAVWEDPTATAVMIMQPGTYAVGCQTDSVWSTGGDGVDPILCAIASLDDDGGIDEWLLVTNETDWVACRRDADPPDNDPPGPTPGALVRTLVAELAERDCSGWAGVTCGFTDELDSYGQPWPSVVVERMLRVGSDTLWSVLRALAETGELVAWMDPDLTLQAAPSRGVDRTGTITLESTHISTDSDEQAEDAGTWAAGLGLAGWSTASEAGKPRREYSMEIGTAISKAVADRVVAAAVAENGRWDGSMRLSPACPWVPMVDFGPGDRIGLDRYDCPSVVTVVSISATQGRGGLLWDLELAATGVW